MAECIHQLLKIKAKYNIVLQNYFFFLFCRLIFNHCDMYNMLPVTISREKSPFVSSDANKLLEQKYG